MSEHSASMIRAGYVQFNPVFGEIRANVEKAATMISGQEADLIVLPELFNTGYQFISAEEAAALAEPVPSGFTSRRLVELSRDLGLHLVAGLAEKAGDRIFNSAILTGPEGFIGVYRKIHLFFEETLWFSEGDTGFTVWKTPVGAIGIMVCFDWFFPESARTLALKGAELIAHPANLVLPYCPEAMITRCIENRVFAITSNRTGTEQRGGKKPLTFIGTSEIVSPAGKVLSRASADEETVSVVGIDLSEARSKQLNEYNNLFGDRKSQFYES